MPKSKPHLFLVLVLVLFLPATSYANADSRVIIRGNQTIFSENRTFQLGFFSTTTNDGDSDGANFTSSSSSNSNWYLGIRYASVPTPTYIWVANRDKPTTHLQSSSLEITPTGQLVVKDFQNGVVWRTKERGTHVKLLETGNLVLVLSAEGKTVWQSFDNPTDTWLPGMNVTGQTLLTCWRSLFDPSPGFYSLRLNPLSYNEFQLVYNSTVEYWSTGNWTGEAFTGVPEMTIPYIYKFHFVNPYTPTASFWYTETALETEVKPPLTRFQVDANGQLKQYTWSPQTSSWNMFWSQPQDRCKVYGLCGELGFCVGGLLKPCACLSGFRPKDGVVWGSGDYTGGCRRNGACEEKDAFELVNEMRYDGNNVGLVDVEGSRSLCERSCLSNCSCIGFYYNEKADLCKMLHGSPLNLRNSSLGAGGISGEVLYVRAPREGVSKRDVSRSVVLVCSIVGSISVLGVTMLVVLLILRKTRMNKKKKIDDDVDFPVLNLRVFSYKELQVATRGFSEKLGHGGFGAVFRGELPDSSPVAVKRLERLGSGEREFRAEVCTIGNIQHVNLVRLRGFCSESSHRLLVYDYMPNGSLSAYLSKSSAGLLTWDVRFKIALGTAKGIAYLHEGCRDCIIHCDIKPENILLDGDYTAKVSDFGLAKLVGRDFSRVLATMRGTWGYVAPEWISGLAITTKADVYSYGMTLLELIGGRRNVEAQQPSGSDGNYCVNGSGGENEKEKWFFPPWAARQVIEGNVDSIVDARLDGEYNVEEAERLAMVSIWCIQDNEEMRPAMGMVVKMLEGVVEVAVPPPPKLIQALVSGESYQGIKTDSSNAGLSSAGSRSSFGKSISPNKF